MIEKLKEKIPEQLRDAVFAKMTMKKKIIIFAAAMVVFGFLLGMLLLAGNSSSEADTETADNTNTTVTTEQSKANTTGQTGLEEAADPSEIDYDSMNYEDYKKAMADSENHTGYSIKEEDEEDEDENKMSATLLKISSMPLSRRMSFLFPNGTPNSANGCASHIVKVTIPITTPSGTKSTTTVNVHEKLAPAVKQIFQELCDMGFPVASVGGYCYRLMASGTGHLSHHSYGVCIDLNAGYNPPSYWGSSPDKNSRFYCNEKVQAVFAKYGFYWGGNWSQRYYDPMHFTYTNH